ncbi:MAG: spore germination protein, partial [Actinobacteria bacterium]|nr:spore germination protein [Actinomycetota bacterium]
GRMAIAVDGTPFVMIVPATFPDFMQAPEDYYERFHVGLLIRLLRWVFLNVSLLLPALYVAVVTFHQEMLPTPFLLSLAAAREGIPFPAMVEALLIEISFEVLREAGVRLPRPVGQAVSIVGALVIGESAVRAAIISAPVVIVVSMTGIASFTIPKFSAGLSIRLLRFPLIILAGALGLFGIMIGLLIILIHLCSLRSFGIPYLASVAPLSVEDQKDVFVRAPWWMMNRRPRLIGYWHPTRQDPGQKPEPPGPRP